MNQASKIAAVAAGTGILALLGMKGFKVYQDKTNQSIANSEKIDKRESVDARKDEAEVGLTQLDSIHRADWQANGFPQTHAERERLEQEGKDLQ